MPTLAQIVSDRATAVLGEGDAALHIEYRPQQASTLAVLRLARDMECFNQETATADDALDLIERLALALHEMVISWDLTEDDRETVMPHTLERLERVGVEVLAYLFGGIASDARAGMSKTSGTRSLTPTSGGSTPRAARTTSRRVASRKR